MTKVKVFIADDFPLLRKGIASFLSQEPNCTVVGETGNGLEAVNEIVRLKPDIAIMDINMPGLGGIQASERIKKECPETKVIILSMHEEARYVSEAFKAGARGYVVKGSEVDELSTAISKVMLGKLYASPAVADELLGGFVENMQKEGASNVTGLTLREMEVLSLICEGSSARAIAGKLFISESTVKTHRSHIMKKLKVKDKASLVRVAIRNGLFSNDNKR